MQNNYKFWDHKYDFAEINNQNKKEVFKEIFYISIKRITILSTLLALEILLTLISKHFLGQFVISNIYVIEISFLGILFIYFVSNWIYATAINLFMSFLRVFVMGSEPVGVIAMSFSDMSFLIIFACLFFIFKKYWLFKKEREKKDNIKVYILIILITGIIASILSAWFSLFLNQVWIFDYYRKAYPALIPVKNSKLWITYLFIGLAVSVAKFLICLSLFIPTSKVFIFLINKHAF